MLELNIVAEPAAPASVKSVKKYRVNNNNKKKARRSKDNKKQQQQTQRTQDPKPIETRTPLVESTKPLITPTLNEPLESSTEQVSTRSDADAPTTAETVLEQPNHDDEHLENQTADDSKKTKIHEGDEEERAKHAEYLARFHPRIHELDRKSGAIKAAVPASQSSKHLFETNDEDEGEINNQISSSPTNTTSSLTNVAITSSTAATGPWQRLQLHPSLLTVLQRQTLARPTTIQRRAIPFLLQNKGDDAGPAATNLLIQSETGSGKTLAYLLPLLQNLMHEVVAAGGVGGDSTRQSVGTKCIILVPTRELALQIFQVVQSFCNHISSPFFANDTTDATESSTATTTAVPHFHLVAGCLSGGEKRKSEKARLRKGIHILVATPGRLLDHLQTTACFSWSGLRYLVLDEADRLVVDMHDVIQQIVEKLQNEPSPSQLPPREGPTSSKNNTPSNHHQTCASWQTILVSATVTPKVQALAQDLLRLDKKNHKIDEDWTRHWHWIKGASANSNSKGPTEDPMDDDDEDFADLTESTPRQLSHIHLTVSAKFRLSTLIAFLVQCVQRQERVVVFMSTCDGVDFHHALFQSMSCLLPQTSSQKSKPGDDDDDDKEQSIFGPFGKVFKLHGNMPHPDRQVIMRQFTKTTTASSSSGNKVASILLATDVAARGLNLPHIDWIVQYDAPMEVSEYVHRAGRAARAGQAGHTLLFLLPSERGLLDVLQAKGVGVVQQPQAAHGMTALSLASVLEQAAKVCLPPSTLANTNSHRLGETFCSEVHRQIEECIWQDTKAKGTGTDGRRNNKRPSRTTQDGAVPVTCLSDMARAAFLSYMRAYPTKEKAIRPIFSVRALHVGHVAKSFGLKEAPTALAKQQRRQHDGQEKSAPPSRRGSEAPPENSNGKKRNAALSFDRKSANASSGQPYKKPRTAARPDSSANGKLSKPGNKGGHTMNKKGKDGGGKFSNGRATLMARAAQLQQNGMDAF